MLVSDKLRLCARTCQRRCYINILRGASWRGSEVGDAQKIPLCTTLQQMNVQRITQLVEVTTTVLRAQERHVF